MLQCQLLLGALAFWSVITQNFLYPGLVEIEVAVLCTPSLQHLWSHFPSNKQVTAVHSKISEVCFHIDLCLEGEPLCILRHLIKTTRNSQCFSVCYTCYERVESREEKAYYYLASQSTKGIALRCSPCSLWANHQSPPMKDMGVAGVCMQRGSKHGLALILHSPLWSDIAVTSVRTCWGEAQAQWKLVWLL